jgi:serine/threonine protein kinase
MPADERPTLPVAIGQIIADKYRVERVLGQGGMGVVVEARHVQLDEKVALKFLLREALGDANAVARFAQEARNAVKIKSEHAVRVTDVGELESGSPYMVMEYLEGEDLADWLERRGALPVEQAVEFILQACVAVADAHALGIVHRDIKPSNLFCVLRSDGQLYVKVLDFGISKLTDSTGAGYAAALTQTNAPMGSPPYMSPEQMQSSKVVDGRTDIWSLGVVLFELLAAHRPFVANSVLEIAIKIANESPAALGELRPGVPAGLEAVILKCLAKDPRERYSDVGELARALRPFAPKRAEALVERISGIRSSSGSGVVPRASASIVVRPAGSSPNPADTALGSTRTVGAPQTSPAVDENEIRAILKPKSPALAIGAGVVLLVLGGGLWVTVGGRPAPRPAHPHGSSGSSGAHSEELRCPKSMVVVPAGTFTMGSDTEGADEKPAHAVALNAFCLDTTEVLVSEYDECVAAKKCTPASKTVSWAGIKPEEKELWSQACNAGRGDDYPINCVSWDDGDAYCQWAKKRLPTEEEWEYAARGKEGRVYPWGNEPPTAKRLNACGAECAKSSRLADQGYVPLFSESDGFELTAPVQSFREGRTPEGIFDMAGNVWEWTASHYCPYPGNNCAGEWRVARGGAWNSDAREGVKASHRDKNAHDALAPDIGFRCAR